MPTEIIYIDHKNKFPISESKLTALLECPVISAAIDVNAATGLTVGVEVPAGAYVTKVALMATTTVVAADIDVGDGDRADRFIDGLTALTANNLVIAPNTATGTNGTTGEVGGFYYEDADTIDVTVNGTGSAGTVKLHVWYDIDDNA